MSQTLDSQAIEARTQQIGRELFAAARREHEQLSVLNRWTTQVLSWCLAEAALKSRVLRFLDVLPSLASSRDITRHLREYFPTSELRLPQALRLGVSLARPGLWSGPALATIVKQLVEQVARQFIADSKTQGATRIIEHLAQQGATCSFDVLGEQVLSEPEADVYVAQYHVLLEQVAAAYKHLWSPTGMPVAPEDHAPDDPTSRPSAGAGTTTVAPGHRLGPMAGPNVTSVRCCGPLVNLSIKPSALCPHFDPISPTPSLTRAAKRLLPLFQAAGKEQALIHLDMEQYELRDLTIELAKHLLVHPQGPESVSLGIVIQAYLKDAEPVLETLLQWLQTHERSLTIRLVKGAYWDFEVAQAMQRNWPIPVHQNKAQTDLAFERLTLRLLQGFPLVRTAIASHNVRSIAKAMALAETLGIPKDQLEFQLLYGMAETLRGAIHARGYPVRIYTPIGQLIPGMGYLVRRLLENTSNDSFLRQDYLKEHQAEELLKVPQSCAPAEDGKRLSRTLNSPESSGLGAQGSGQASTATSQKPKAESGSGIEFTGEPFLNAAQASQREGIGTALTTIRQKLGRHYPLLLGDGTVETSSHAAIANPANPSELLGSVAQASAAEVDRAVCLAEQAQASWASVGVSERVQKIRQAAVSMRCRRYELAAIEIIEVGKTWREADADVVEAIDYLEYYSLQMQRLAGGQPLIQRPGECNVYRYFPRGVAAVIAPWNFPLAILTGMASAALVSGNAVILKPAKQSPIIAAILTQLLREAGIPPAVVQYLPGHGETVGAALVQHPQVAQILFTGSRPVGLSIIRSAASVPCGQRMVKHVVAEMGGKNAVIVDADADLDAAVCGSLISAFGYGGQKCSAASRLIVHESVMERFLERLTAATDRLIVGDPADPDTDIGPLIDLASQQRLGEAIAHAHAVARVVYEYPQSRLPRSGYFLGPAIVADVPKDDYLAYEELFGPLVCVFRFGSFSEALRLANDTDYALTGGIFSRSPQHIRQAKESFDVGNLYINRPITGAVVGRQPFGGHRLSGLGTQAGGPDYLFELLMPKTIAENTARHGMPLEPAFLNLH